MINKLSEPINISNLNDLDDILNRIYEIYKKDLMEINSRKKLFNEFVFIDCKKWINNKPEIFWHLISLSENERFNVFPCTNDPSYKTCNENCLQNIRQIKLSDGKKRNICYYRAVRIKWINEIIHLANINDPRVKKWILNNKLHIRYQEGEVDYILIFADKNSNNKNHYYLITAFPVFYINSKKGYDKDYNNKK